MERVDKFMLMSYNRNKTEQANFVNLSAFQGIIKIIKHFCVVTR